MLIQRKPLLEKLSYANCDNSNDPSHNTDILNYNSALTFPEINIERVDSPIAPTSGQYGRILPSIFNCSNTGYIYNL